jgi:hypothetical protein
VVFFSTLSSFNPAALDFAAIPAAGVIAGVLQ